MSKLTIGMAHYDDFPGLWATIQSIRITHSEVMSDCELLVVDNNPTSAHGANAKDLIEGWVAPYMAARYIEATEVVGTSYPRDVVFREATGDAVLCVDCHIQIVPGAIWKLIDYYDSKPETDDLLSGPMLMDDLRNIATHFSDVWGEDGMWGQWATDDRGTDPNAEPFEIQAMGLGLFSCRKDAWLGFNPHFRGFGGEEHYIHEKFRQSGARCLCLPFLQWAHRFGKILKPDGHTYPVTHPDRARNYVIGHRELGLSLANVRKTFVSTGRISPVQWQAYKHEADTISDFPIGEAVGNVSVLDSLYKTATTTPSDINEHCTKLREMATQCSHVTDHGHRTASSVALLAGQPEVLVSYTYGVADLRAHAGDTELQLSNGNWSTTIDETDMLFIDPTTCEDLQIALARHSERVRRWIVIHDTEIYGERAPDGTKGFLYALRWFVRVHDGWRVVYHARHNNGLTVISRDEERPKRPAKLACNLQRITSRHDSADKAQVIASELLDRLSWCTLCDQRDGCRCGVRGAPIRNDVTKKIGQCPLGKWYGDLE